MVHNASSDSSRWLTFPTKRRFSERDLATTAGAKLQVLEKRLANEELQRVRSLATRSGDFVTDYPPARLAFRSVVVLPDTPCPFGTERNTRVMPKLSQKVLKYRRHSTRNVAFVLLDRKADLPTRLIQVQGKPQRIPAACLAVGKLMTER